MFDFLTLKPAAFGLDISDSSLKIIKLEKRRGTLGLASFMKQDLQPGIIEAGEIKDEEALAKAIKELLLRLRGEKLSTRYVVASLPEEKAFLQVIQMPPLTAEELKKAIGFEAENYIPLPLKDVCLDFQVVRPLYNHLDHLDVLIVALPRKTIERYLSALKKAGLRPLALETESQATTRAVIKNEVSPFPVLLIDIGPARTNFIIFSGYSLRFTSSIPVSSRKLTEAIARNLAISLPEAERLKIKNGLAIKNGREGGAVFEALIPPLTDLSEQMRACLSYYQTHAAHEHLLPNGRSVEKIFICGEGAGLNGLSAFFSREFKIPAVIGNPWVNILPDKPKEVPGLPYKESLTYTTALGLALRGINEKSK